MNEFGKADLLLVDGNSIMNRAYYGLAGRQNLSAPDGTPTGAVFAFFNMLFSYADKLHPSAVKVCFDRPEKNFRHELFKDYKAGRSAMPDDLRVQMPLVKEGIRLMGGSALEKPGHEADDLIAALTKKSEKEGKRVYILSGDRDLWQLISDQTTVIFPFTGKSGSSKEWMTIEAFREKYGFDPPFLRDLKSIMGDSSDAIPGVPGIGEKGALELIRSYGSLDGVYAHLAEIKGAKQKRLHEGEESARLSYTLVGLNTELPFSEAELASENLDTDGLDKFLTRLGIQSLRKRFGLSEEGGRPADEWELHWKTVKSPEELQPCAAPGETWILAELDEVWLAVYDHTEKLFVCRTEEIGFLWTRLLACKPNFILWAGKDFLRKYDLEVPVDFFYDCEIAAYLLNHLNQSKNPETDMLRAIQAACGKAVIFTASAELTGDSLEREAVLRCRSLRAMAEGQKKMLRELGMEDLAYELEFPLAMILTKMEAAGIRVDLNRLKELSAEMGDEILSLENKIFDLIGEPINLNSSKQLSEVLFERLGLKGGKKKKDGTYSTAADELERLWDDHPVIPLIVEHREVSKLRSTFVEGLVKEVAEDGRIHTTFKQTLTTTGRLSSAAPNLQNIPTKSDRAGAIRRIFIAKDGCRFIDADYSQIELRLLAAMSGDEALQSAFRDHIDIHKATAMRLFGKPAEAVTANERRAAKTVNFSIVYGISDFGLARDLGVPVYEAKKYIEAYDEHYPKVRPWMMEQVKQAKEKGYVSTMMGRRRYIDELKSANFHLRKFGERAAMNAPVQGSAADLIKLAMVKVDRELQAAGMKTRLILQVHDELLLESPEDEVEKASEILRRCMEKAMTLSVPLEVELGVGTSWDEVK